MSSQKPRKHVDRRVNADPYQFGFIQRVQQDMQSQTRRTLGLQDATRAVLDAGLRALFGDDYSAAPLTPGVPMFESMQNGRLGTVPACPNQVFSDVHNRVGMEPPAPPKKGSNYGRATMAGGLSFFESAPNQARKRDPMADLNVVELGVDVLSVYDAAREYANGDADLARQIMSQHTALCEAAPGLYYADDVAEAFDYGNKVPGSNTYAKREAQLRPVKSRMISLMVENASPVKKITLETAAHKYFSNSEYGARAHLKGLGLSQACDRTGAYLESFFTKK